MKRTVVLEVATASPKSWREVGRFVLPDPLPETIDVQFRNPEAWSPQGLGDLGEFGRRTFVRAQRRGQALSYAENGELVAIYRDDTK